MDYFICMILGDDLNKMCKFPRDNSRSSRVDGLGAFHQGLRESECYVADAVAKPLEIYDNGSVPLCVPQLEQ